MMFSIRGDGSDRRNTSVKYNKGDVSIHRVAPSRKHGRNRPFEIMSINIHDQR